MNKKSILPLLLVSAALLSGCEKKKEAPAEVAKPAATPAATAGASTTAQPGMTEQVKQTAADVVASTKAAGAETLDKAKAAVKDVSTETKASVESVVGEVKTSAASAGDAVKEVARDAKKEADSFLTQFKTSATATTSSTSTALAASASEEKTGDLDIKGLVEKVTESAKGLMNDASVTDAVKEQLKKLTDGVSSSNDAEATSALAKIVALKPSDEQLATVKELQANLGVLVLGRDFEPADAAASGAINQTIRAIKAKDTTAAVAGLQKIYSTAKPTDAQKQLVSNLLASYDAKLAGVSETVEKAGSVLKGFGL